MLQQALADLNTAYRNFFASVTGKRKGRRVAPPRFRSRKDNRQAIRFTKNSGFKVLSNGRLRLPKIGDGRTFPRVDRFFPSARMCSACGRINEKMALNVRSWPCPCGAGHDRDVNAAKNVLAAGRADNSNDRGARVRPASVPAPRGEAVTHPDAACSTRSVEGISVL